jgi:hypothetical protein
MGGGAGEGCWGAAVCASEMETATKISSAREHRQKSVLPRRIFADVPT